MTTMPVHDTTPIAKPVPGLQLTFGLCVAALVAGLIAAMVAGVSEPATPGWLGLAIVLVAGIPALFVVHFWRIRPVSPGRLADYRSTVLLRIAVATMPGILGIASYPIAGSRVVVAIGVLIAFAALAGTFPTAIDFRRHQDLWVAKGHIPTDEVWGSAPHDEVAPWEDATGGHGHGPHDI